MAGKKLSRWAPVLLFERKTSTTTASRCQGILSSCTRLATSCLVFCWNYLPEENFQVRSAGYQGFNSGLEI